MHKMIVYISVERGRLHFKMLHFHTTTTAIERRENRGKRLRSQSKRSFAVRPPQSTGQVFNTEYIFKDAYILNVSMTTALTVSPHQV